MTSSRARPNASDFLARQFPWRYDPESEIEVIVAGHASTRLQEWQTPVYHMADGSSTVSEIVRRLAKLSPSDGGGPGDVETAVLDTIDDLLERTLISRSEKPVELARDCYLSIDGEP